MRLPDKHPVRQGIWWHVVVPLLIALLSPALLPGRPAAARPPAPPAGAQEGGLAPDRPAGTTPEWESSAAMRSGPARPARPAGLGAAPAWTATGKDPGDSLGYSVATAGDVDGDGFADVLVGANGYPSGAARGIAYAYMGSETGLTATPAFTVTGEAPGDRLGSYVAAAGDVNGDGFADILVGAPGYGSSRGQVSLFLGSTAGLAAVAAFTVTGGAEGDRLGRVAAAGDINGDGFADILVAADGYPEGQFQGQAVLFLGSASGLGSTPAWTVTGGPGDRLGIPATTAGDVDGDGFADVLVGSPGYPEGSFRGKVEIYRGSAAGLAASPAWVACGENDFDFFGGSAATAGDVNRDGYADVVVGASGFLSNTGRVDLFFGSAAGLAASPSWSATGEGPGSWFGSGVATAGDVDGDGHADVAVSADGYLTNTGQVDLFLGAAAGLAPAPAWSTAGQTEGDHLGMALGSAGDVDGDGFADLLVGAFGYPGGVGQGRAYLYRGAADRWRVCLPLLLRGP